MIGVRIEGQGFALVKFDRFSCRYVVAAAVTAHQHWGVEFLFGLRVGVVQVEHRGAATAHDDVFHLVPVEMHRGDLAWHAHHDLLGVHLGVLWILHIAIAQGDQSQALVLEVTFTVIGDIPAQGVITDLIPFVTLFGPLLRSEAQVWRNPELVLVEQGLELLDDRIDFRMLHGENSFVIHCDVYASVVIFDCGVFFVFERFAFRRVVLNNKHFRLISFYLRFLSFCLLTTT